MISRKALTWDLVGRVVTDDMVVLFRAMALVDGTCRNLDPDINYSEFAQDSGDSLDWFPPFVSLPTKVASTRSSTQSYSDRTPVQFMVPVQMLL